MENQRTAVYSHMLSLQARLQFPFERHFYQFDSWRRAKSVLDFGCGNAAYAALLDSHFPGKSFVGVEADPQMRALAEGRCPTSMAIYGSIDEVPPVSLDFVLLRLVLLHVEDRQSVYRFIRSRCAPDSAVLVFDAEDDALAFDPEPTEFVRALAALRGQSKNRRLRGVVESELAEHGFELAFSDSIVVSNAFPHTSEDLFKYMYRTAELGVGRPLPEALHRELLEWWLEGPYVQYGFFGQLFQRRGGE